MKFLCALLFAVALPVTCLADISIVQSQSAFSSAIVNSISATFDHPNTRGCLIIVGISESNNLHVASLTDTQGNNYVESSAAGYNLGMNISAAIFYAKNIAGGSGNQITVSFTAGEQFVRLIIHEVCGMDTVNPLDQSAFNSGSSGTITSGAVATTTPYELVFGWGISNNGTGTAGSGFTLWQASGSETSEYQLVSSTGNYAATYPADGSAWLCLIATFKGVGGSGGAYALRKPLIY